MHLGQITGFICPRLSSDINLCVPTLWTDQGPDVNLDFRPRWQVIRSYWVHLWCSPSAGCNQSAGRLYEEVTVSLLSLFCVFRESTPPVGFLCSVWLKLWVESLRSIYFFQFLHIFFPPINDSHFTFGFWVPCLLFVYLFDRISGWLCFIPTATFRMARDQLVLTLLWFYSVLLVPQPATTLSFRFCFLGKYNATFRLSTKHGPATALGTFQDYFKLQYINNEFKKQQ